MNDLTLKPKFRKLRSKLGLHASWSEIFYVHRKETESLRQPEVYEKYRPQTERQLTECSMVTTKRWHSTFNASEISNAAIYANPGYDSIDNGWDKSSGSDYGTLSKSSASDYGTLSSTSSHDVRYKTSRHRQKSETSSSDEHLQPTSSPDYASWDSNAMKEEFDDSLVTPPSQPDEELSDFCDYFERRKKAVQKWSPTHAERTATPVEEKMSHLRTEIASLVAQDDALFKQLLSLREAISSLKVRSPTTGFTTPSSSESEADESEAGDDSGDHIYSEIDVPARRRRYLQHSETVRSVRPEAVLSEGQPVRRPQSFPGRHREKQFADSGRPPKRAVNEVPASKSKHSLKQCLSVPTSDRSGPFRRKCSFDSGFQGSEQSDAEVFV